MGEPSNAELRDHLAKHHSAVMTAVTEMGNVIQPIDDARVRTLADAARLYEIDANRERRVMWRLMAGVVLCFALVAIILTVAAEIAIPKSATEHVDAGRFLLLSSISGPLMFTAVYLGRQSSLRRRPEAVRC